MSDFAVSRGSGVGAAFEVSVISYAVHGFDVGKAY